MKLTNSNQRYSFSNYLIVANAIIIWVCFCAGLIGSLSYDTALYDMALKTLTYWIVFFVGFFGLRALFNELMLR